MRRIAATVLVVVLGCRSTPPPPPPASEPTLFPEASEPPPAPQAVGPYAYDPEWTVPPAQYMIVTEVEFGAAHKLADCAREFAASLIEHPDTRIFPGAVTARNEYGDQFHGHLIDGERDELVLPDKDGLRVTAKSGTLVLVTSPAMVESPEAKALVPAHTLSLKITDADPAVLSAQPFATAVRPKAGGEEFFVTAMPHNEGEAIFGIYEKSKTHVATAQFAHGDAVLQPRFVVEVDGWQKVGTYPFPPDLPPDAAGTQMVSLELKEGAEPVKIAFPGRPVISTPTKPVVSRADVFVSFFGLPEVRTHFTSGYGFVKEATPVMKVESKEVTAGVKNAATSIDLDEEAEGGRTVFYIHRVSAEWREKGGRVGCLFAQERPAVFERAVRRRPIVRSSASAFMRQIHFRGRTERPAGAGGGVVAAVIPGSILGDAARGFGAALPAYLLNAAASGGSGSPEPSTSSAQSVTNVYINVSHDPSTGGFSVGGAGAMPGPGSAAPTAMRQVSGGGAPTVRQAAGTGATTGTVTPRSPYELVPNTSYYRPGSAPLTTTGGAAAAQRTGMQDPYTNYQRSPTTGQVTSSYTPYGQSTYGSGSGYTGSGSMNSMGYDAVSGNFTFPQYTQPVYRRQNGW